MVCSTAKVSPLLIAGLLLFIFAAEGSPVGFDVREHLSTTSRYEGGKASLEETPLPPPGCEPVHLNLVARHGMRSPTKKRMRELDLLASRIAKQLEDDPEEHTKCPAWLHGFRSHWEGEQVGGELVSQGEEDMYHLGQRLRQRFPSLFKQTYRPVIYPIIATRVSRSAASAVALGMGLFENRGALGEGKHRAFSVITDNSDKDSQLRFHESCSAYKESKELRKPEIQSWQDKVFLQVGMAVSARLNLSLSTEDTASLWLLCKQEAAILEITDRACGLFKAAEVELLEWADDIETYHLKAYGESINYRMGVPLLQDVLTSMELAISAIEDPQFGEFLEVAKLRVAHAETVIPFTCLLGLFLEGADVKILQSEEPLKTLPPPPHPRNWKGSLVAPFSANTQLVLYKCLKDSRQSEVKSIAESKGYEYLVQVLHNEKPVTMLACNGEQFCPFKTFKEEVAGPHLQHSFGELCTVKVTQTKQNNSEHKKSLAEKFLLIASSFSHGHVINFDLSLPQICKHNGVYARAVQCSGICRCPLCAVARSLGQKESPVAILCQIKIKC